jgi:DNA-binding NarL/FixJ family response regulator
MKRILIADDHAAVRFGLRAVLEQRPGWEVIADVDDGRKAVEVALEKRPDVAILDFSLPYMTGVEVARLISKHLRETEVLIFTVHESRVLAQEAFRAGARAYLVKSDANKLLLTAVEALMTHRSFDDGRFSAGPRRERNGADAGGQKLSPRERHVVTLVAEGYSNKKISSFLNLSVKTTEAHRATAMRKLGINSIASLVRYAVRSNMIEP